MAAASSLAARACVAPNALPRVSSKAAAGRASSRALPRVAPRAALADIPKENKDTKVLVVGATGYIGKFVVRELCAQVR